MPLRIETFDNTRGGNTLYKALTHPAAARPAQDLLNTLVQHAPIAVYDPNGAAEAFDALFNLAQIEIAEVFVQQVSQIGATILGRRARPITDLARCCVRRLFVTAFDAERTTAHLRAYLPQEVEVVSLDAMRIPPDRLTNPRLYLDPLNFATNFAFFRDTARSHTRLTTMNYWAGYGADAVTLWLTLFSEDGQILAEWAEKCIAPGSVIIVDSREIRERFRLTEFCGQLFIHVIGAAGHDVVKYALDTFADDRSTGVESETTLSCTHDANAWPAERYAGLPAPAVGEETVLWIQNSHPVPIPSSAVGLNLMGEEIIAPIVQEIAPFATYAAEISTLFPSVTWPKQIELRAGKHMVRPRYEVLGGRGRRIAHVNVERTDLDPNPELRSLEGVLGKGYLLPAPIMSRASWQTIVLPTPMAERQAELPLAARVYDPDGNEIGCHPFGRLPRAHSRALDLDEVEATKRLGNGYGHVELVYDFSAGGEGDGWLHALFRYRHRYSGHAAETSFGAHVFNTILTYRDEPQSYAGRPPGLSTRLFLRLGAHGFDTLCHLIYPASRPWLPTSTTDIILYDAGGSELARSHLAIPCSGSRLWYYHSAFDREARARGAYVIVRDTTCRIFGYHGLISRDGRFSLDHMFGF